MSPRLAPDLDQRRDLITRVAREIAEAEGWEAVTMRRVAHEIGVTQPVLYSAFPSGRQSLVDAVAVMGFTAMAEVLEAAAPDPAARLRTYLEFAHRQPGVYAAMFSVPSSLQFATGRGPAPLRRAFAAMQAAFPGPDDTAAEVAWATAHGLATLEINNRLPASRSAQRLDMASKLLTPRT